MLKLLVALVLGSGIAIPSVQAVTAPGGDGVAPQQLLRQMNSGPAGTVTRSVRCTPARAAFACTLQGRSSTVLDARFVVHDGGTEIDWAPLRG
jgi:hypothetical protein